MTSTEITTAKSLTKAELEKWAYSAKLIRTEILVAAYAIITAGDRLALVKADLGHGKFLQWIDRELQMTDRTARNYMRAAAWAKGKSEIVSDLPPSTLYLLAAPSTPPEVAEMVIADIESGKPIDIKEVKTRIEEARVEQEEISQDNPKPAQAKKCRRSRDEIARHTFMEGALPQLCGFTSYQEQIQVPHLSRADAKKAVAELKAAEGGLRSIRREIEKQHADLRTARAEVDQAVNDEDPLVIPAVFRREKTA